MIAACQRIVRNTFIAGLVIVLPAGITLVLLQTMFVWVDALFAPMAKRLAARPVPGLGIVVTMLLVFGVGLLVTNILGRAFVSFGEHLVARIPFIRSIYYGAKQVLETLTTEHRQAFTQVVMVEYPKRGSYSLGFVTGETCREIQQHVPEPLINVFISTAPNPTTGFLLLVPKKEAAVVPISIEDALKMVMSGGILPPSEQQP